MQDPPQSHHRRAHSESTFRLPDNLSDPFTGSEDDLFTTYMDMEKLGSSSEESTRPRHRYSNSVDGIEAKKAMAPEQLAELWTVDPKKAKSTYMDMDKFGSSFGQCGGEEEGSTRPRHRYSNLVDGIEAKKAMAPEKLAEFWTVNPKKAKRIIANRQSAARSKERKARYITELERKVLTLQTEAATLSAQLTMFQRDTTGLSNENTALKFRLQAMEQQAQLRDALNEALKQEVERLKFATGEFPAQSDTYNFGMQNFQYSQTSFFKQQPHQGPNDTQSLHTPLPNHQHSNDIINHHNSLLMGSHSQAFSDILQQDSLGHFQGLDINARGTHLVKSEGPSISASESSTTF